MKKFFIVISIVLIVAVGGFVSFLYSVCPKFDNKGVERLEEKDPLAGGTDVFQGDQILRVLVLGVDKTATLDKTEEENGMRSDTIMLFSLDPKTHRAQLLSVPRDSYIRIHGYGKNKINAAFSEIVYPGGGVNLVAQTLEDLLNVKIDNYAIMDYKAVSSIVDAVGGVDVEWKYDDYTYTDDWVVPPLKIEMKRGINHLDGEKAVNYLRARKAYPGMQDIMRIGAQQDFLMLLFDKVKNPAILLKIPELIDIVDRYVETDLTYGQMLTLAKFGLGLTRETIDTATLEGTGQSGVLIGRDKVDVYVVDPAVAQSVILRDDTQATDSDNGTQDGVGTDGTSENSTADDIGNGNGTAATHTNDADHASTVSGNSTNDTKNASGSKQRGTGKVIIQSN
ncbi:LCP family protein [Peptoniphilus equinus]|uniref:LCP family protein n=1 Tax=Peptoniphilus equinus TaxID=3016343 RepID=A0ABY7QST4_9FIRM|nr:LCP family protein [Peptoniphilus equinus]WBW49850.1 LCP family protein [Peptoniphilus equinus]